MYDGNTNPVNLATESTPAVLQSAFDSFGEAMADRYAPDGLYRSVPSAGQMCWDAAHYWEKDGYVLNVDVLASDMIHESAGLQTEYVREKNNPSGLGAENDDPFRKANSFHHLFYGMLATTAHFFNYFVGYGPWSVVDPRTDVLRKNGWLGIAKKLIDLNGRWASPGPTYGQGIGNLANDVQKFKPKDYIMPNPIIQANNIYGVPFRVALIPLDNPNRTNITTDQADSPVIHETGNVNVGADAEMHRRFVFDGGGKENVSFQFVVDDHEIIQLLPLYEKGVHAGNSECNIKRPGIEHCINSDGDFNMTMANGTKLARFLGEYDSRMAAPPVQHFNCSGKNCPSILRAGRWDEYLSMVGSVNVPTPADPNAERFVYMSGTDEVEYWIVNQNVDGYQIDMLNFYRDIGGFNRLGYPESGMIRKDENGIPRYEQRCENVLMECWPEGFGNLPGPYYRFGKVW